MGDADSRNNFDNRNDEEIDRDKEQRYTNEAKNQLYSEGKLGFWGTDEQFWEQERLINSRVNELKEKNEYNRLKEKYM